MRSEVITTVAKVLRVEASQVQETSSPDSLADWDSLTHLTLISALEREFDLKFNMREIQSMDTVANIEAVLDSRGVPA